MASIELHIASTNGVIYVVLPSSLKGWKCDLISLYNITGVPALFVLNENNQIIATGLRGEQLREFLEERLR